MRSRRGKLATAVVAVAAAASATVAVAAVTSTGRSSSESPYVVPTASGIEATSILTVGDAAANGYRMVGIPDGLGALDNGNGTFTLLMNHELRPGQGSVRAHGADGAFVSKWTISKRSLEVLAGDDLIRRVARWNGSSYDPPAQGVALNRLCSADLPARSAFYNPLTRRGYEGRLFLSGEEAGSEGRAFAHDLDGTSWELPWLGKASWENLVANPLTGDKTVVVGLDDTGGGLVYVYIGDKRRGGNPVERAGIAGGRLFAIAVEGHPVEPAGGIASGTRFDLVEIADPETKSGAQIAAEAKAQGATAFNRPEDGAWNPRDARDFYWVTTAGFGNPSRLWRLSFSPWNLLRPTFGGTIDMLLDGDEGQEMLDNVTVDDGHVLMQEDVGGNVRLGKIWDYAIARDTLTEIAEHDPSRFLPTGSDFRTTDEEASGIVPAPFLGDGAYLLDVQVHRSNPDAELVQDGQLLLLELGAKRRGRGHDR